MRVLLIFPGALGDLLLLAPSIAALAGRGEQVELSVQRALVPVVERLLRFPTGPPADGVEIGTLYASAPSAALAAWVRGADVVHGWLGREAQEAARRLRELGAGAVLLHSVVRGEGATHASAEYGALLGVRPTRRIPVAPLESQCAPIEWACPRAGRLVIHPGAGSRAKRWSASGFARVAEAWNAAGGTAVMVAGPAESDLTEQWRAAGLRVARDLELLEVADLLASAPVYLGNDSGISHLAGALDRSGVVLFGPTHPARWRPLAPGLEVVRFSDRETRDVVEAVLRRLRPGLA